jgi:glycosyltransferase involved in cell wall biosynthesis
METHRAALSKHAPSVSVILTAYNVAPFLKRAVDSALGQSLTDFEMIVVDDGSTDECGEILATIRDPRLRVIRQSNAGSAVARNRCISAARGEFLAFLDGDDFWTPNYLQRHLDILRDHPRIDLTFALCTIVDAAGAVRGLANVRRAGPVSFRELLVDNHIRCGSAVVVRSAAILAAGCFDPSLTACIDYDAWLRVLLLREGNS